MELFFTGRRAALAVADQIPWVEPAEVAALFERRVVPEGMPVLLDAGMRPVEPLSSWFRHLALAGRSPKTMRKYAYITLRLSDFLARRGTDLVSATEQDLLEYRLLRGQVQEPIAKATWEVEATAINGRYAWLVQQGRVSARPWRSSGQRDSLRNGITRDLRVRHMTLEQYLFFRDVGWPGAARTAQSIRRFAVVARTGVGLRWSWPC